MKLNEKTRGALIELCRQHATERFADDLCFRAQVAETGFPGFANLCDADLVHAFCDAGLPAWHPEIQLPESDAGLGDVELIRADEDVAPLSPAQETVVRACVERFSVERRAWLYETLHGHVVELRQAAAVTPLHPGRLTQKDLAFLASFGERIRWVECHPGRLTLAL